MTGFGGEWTASAFSVIRPTTAAPERRLVQSGWAHRLGPHHHSSSLMFQLLPRKAWRAAEPSQSCCGANRPWWYAGWSKRTGDLRGRSSNQGRRQVKLRDHPAPKCSASPLRASLPALGGYYAITPGCRGLSGPIASCDRARLFWRLAMVILKPPSGYVDSVPSSPT